MSKKYNIAVVGATGAVGKEMLRMLSVRNFPVDGIYLFASERSEGKKIKFNDKEVKVENLAKLDIARLKKEKNIHIALFSAGGSISKEFAPKFAREKIYVIDNSSAWRMEPGIPLIVPEVNPDEIKKEKFLIANPNCSTIQMVVVLAPLHKEAKIKRIVVSTYQSVSGAGGKAMDKLLQETSILLQQIKKRSNILESEKEDFNLSEEKEYKISSISSQIAFNLVPQIDVFLENLYTKEEIKMVNETRKILSDESIMISATCVRVPVFRGHSETVWIETEKKLSIVEAKRILSNANGVEVIDNINEENPRKRYPVPVECAFEQITYVGRIREDISCDKGLVMWIVSDNLLKGAALNAVQIAELLISKEII